MEAAGFPDVRLLACAAVALCLVVLSAPKDLRLTIALAMTSFLMTVSRLRDLGELAVLAKASAGVALVLVIASALTAPGRRRQLAIYSWLHPAAAVFSLFCVMSAVDRNIAMSVRLQWIALVLAALATAKTVVSHAALMAILRGIYIGLALAGLIVVFPLVSNPISAFAGGFGRFSPYGCNPNQIGIMLSITAVLSLYFTLRSRSTAGRVACGVLGGVCAGALCLTVSRAGLGVMAFASLPSLLLVWRRPAVIMLLGLFALAAVHHVWSTAGEIASLDHLSAEGKESRLSYAIEAFEVASERPLFGLLTSTDIYAQDIENNAHNAYIEMIYLGGAFYFVPVALLIVMSLPPAIALFRWPRSTGYDPLLVRTIVLLYAGSLASGCVNTSIHYPIYTWAFLHAFLCHFVLNHAGVARPERAPERRRPAPAGHPARGPRLALQ